MTMPPIEVVVAMVVIGVATYSIRASFIFFADRLMGLPDDVRVLLRMVPAAAMAALTIPALLRPGGEWDVFGPNAIAGLVAGLVAFKTGNAFLTVIVGLIAVAVLQPLMG